MAATMEPQWTLGDRLTKARQVAHISREEMAAQLGTTKGSVWNWENDVSRPRDIIDTTRRWSDLTGVSIEWILGLRGGDSNSQP